MELARLEAVLTFALIKNIRLELAAGSRRRLFPGHVSVSAASPPRGQIQTRPALLLLFSSPSLVKRFLLEQHLSH